MSAHSYHARPIHPFKGRSEIRILDLKTGHYRRPSENEACLRQHMFKSASQPILEAAVREAQAAWR